VYYSAHHPFSVLGGGFGRELADFGRPVPVRIEISFWHGFGGTAASWPILDSDSGVHRGFEVGWGGLRELPGVGTVRSERLLFYPSRLELLRAPAAATLATRS
jgi:hypothetical protein